MKYSPIRYTARCIEKPWGIRGLSGLSGQSPGQRIGEIWYQPVEQGELPLLVKYIFTSERLSVQVHPSDQQAAELGLSGGKEECWYVLDSTPEACIGIGTTVELDGHALRNAVQDGSIVELMDWQPVRPGDFFHVPCGTIHAIGAGISLVEIQQNNDATFRLYDYGRGRELHLDQGLAVSRARPYPLKPRNVALGDSARLLDGNHACFTVDLVAASPGETMACPASRAWFVPIEGAGTLDGHVWSQGECWQIEPGCEIRAEAPSSALIAYIP